MSETAPASSVRWLAPPRWLQVSLAVVPFLTLLVLSWRGVDYGTHWDEDFNKVNAVAASLEHGFTLLPDGYIYPGVNYWLTVAALAPEIRAALKIPGADSATLRTALIPVLHSDAFHLRLRRLFAFIAALTAMWLYWGILVWDDRWWQALVGSLLFAVAWEIIYHARWIAPDEVLMQFGALTFLGVGMAWRKKWRWAGTAAAISAGLACGTKYPGGLILWPVLLLPFFAMTRRSDLGRALLTAVKYVVIFVVTYLLTTPGTVLQPFVFAESLAYSKQAYAEGWYGYSVAPGWNHLGKLLYYFGNSLFSAFPAVSWGGAALGLLGLWVTTRRSWREIILVLIFPLAYVAFFAQQGTMVVRNSLIVAPFLFFLLSRGVAWICEQLPDRRLVFGVFTAVTAVVVVEGIDQFRAGSTIISRKNSEVFTWDFVRYIEAHPEKKILVSERVEQDLRQINVWPRPNLTAKAVGIKNPFDLYASYYDETMMPYELEWQTNRPSSFTAVFGPRDVNLDYYSGWHGSDRIILMSPRQIKESKIPAW